VEGPGNGLGEISTVWTQFLLQVKAFLKSAFRYYDNGGANAPSLIELALQII